MKKYDVFALGHALMDVVAEVDEAHLAGLKLKKGSMHLIEGSVLKIILKAIRDREKRIVPAGSAANTAMGVAALGGLSVFAGKVGNDQNGRAYHSILSKTGVSPSLLIGKGITGTCISMVTPDSERTMTTFLGVSSTVMKHELDTGKLKASNILHMEGYQWNEPHQQETALHAMEVAGNNNVKVSFDLGDPSLVEKNRKDFRRLLRNNVSIVFANEAEASALTLKKNPEAALNALAELCDIAVVKLGEKGSIISYKGKVIHVNAVKTKAVDTTGAGDLYAAGFLHGSGKGYTAEKCGNLGSFVASKIVSQYGAMPPKDLKSQAERFLEK